MSSVSTHKTHREDNYNSNSPHPYIIPYTNRENANSQSPVPLHAYSSTQPSQRSQQRLLESSSQNSNNMSNNNSNTSNNNNNMLVYNDNTQEIGTTTWMALTCGSIDPKTGCIINADAHTIASKPFEMSKAHPELSTIKRSTPNNTSIDIPRYMQHNQSSALRNEVGIARFHYVKDHCNVYGVEKQCEFCGLHGDHIRKNRGEKKIAKYKSQHKSNGVCEYHRKLRQPSLQDDTNTTTQADDILDITVKQSTMNAKTRNINLTQRVQAKKYMPRPPSPSQARFEFYRMPSIRDLHLKGWGFACDAKPDDEIDEDLLLEFNRLTSNNMPAYVKKKTLAPVQHQQEPTNAQPQTLDEIPFVVKEKGPWPLVPKTMSQSMYKGYTKQLKYVFPVELLTQKKHKKQK